MANSKRTSQLIAAANIIGLVALTFILIFSMNFLSWPIGTLLGQQEGGQIVVTSTVQPGMLVVTTEGIRATVGANSTDSISLAHTVPAPMGNISLTVSRAGSIARPPIEQTDPNTGSFSVYLSPDSYEVRILDGRFGNLSLVVQVSEGTMTNVTAIVNETDYSLSAFNLIDSDNSGWFGGWQQAFGRISTNNTIPSGNGVYNYIGVSNSAYQFTGCANCLPIQTDTPNLVPATITSSSQTFGSQWLQIHLNELAQVEGILGLMLINQHVTYTVNSIVS